MKNDLVYIQLLWVLLNSTYLYHMISLYFYFKHPRVRYAGCNAVGQLCRDFGPLFQKKYHSRVSYKPVTNFMQYPIHILREIQGPCIRKTRAMTAHTRFNNFLLSCKKWLLLYLFDDHVYLVML